MNALRRIRDRIRNDRRVTVYALLGPLSFFLPRDFFGEDPAELEDRSEAEAPEDDGGYRL